MAAPFLAPQENFCYDYSAAVDQIPWSMDSDPYNLWNNNPYSVACVPETNNYIHQDEREWINYLPIGMRFCPTDQELIEFYLKPRVLGLPIPALGIINEVNIYDHEPQALKGFTYDQGDGHMYFFTPLKEKHNSKIKIERAINGGKFGFWKATQKKTNILDINKVIIGTKASLTHNSFTVNEGNERIHKKEDWLMAEYRLPEKFYQEHCEVANKEEIALCEIYLTPRAKNNV